MSKAEPSSGNASQVQMESVENQIVVYQPNETVRLDVRLENETVWLNQARLVELFCVDRTVVNRHIHNIYKTGELDESATCAKIAQVQVEGGRSIMRTIPFYNLDMIIAVGYCVNSLQTTRFQQWANTILKAQRGSTNHQQEDINALMALPNNDCFLITDCDKFVRLSFKRAFGVKESA